MQAFGAVTAMSDRVCIHSQVVIGRVSIALLPLSVLSLGKSEGDPLPPGPAHLLSRLWLWLSGGLLWSGMEILD